MMVTVFTVPDARDYLDDPTTFYDQLSPSEAWGRADQDLAAVRNSRVNNVTPETVTSKIRVTLSRPLTWAEIEALETDNTDAHSRRLKDTQGEFRVWVDREFHDFVYVEAAFGSRIAYELIAAAMEYDFVNVYPTAVLTKREYNGE